MKKTILFFSATAVLFFFTIESGSQSLYFPPLTGTTWETTTPESLNWRTDSIAPLMEFLSANRSKAFIVLKDGRIVLEQYFGTFTSDSLWYWASAGKSMTAFLIGIAQQDGLISINDSTSHYIGAGWTTCPPEKEGLITILHQLTMTSGLDDWVVNPECTSPDCLQYKADAGTRWAYHTGAYTILDEVIKNVTGQTINGYFISKIRSKTGMTGAWASVGYNNIYFSNARSMARFGLLALNHGVWDTDTLLADTSYFHDMTNTSQGLNPSYGYLWWLNGKASYMVPVSQLVFSGSWAPDAPSDMFSAIGKSGQFINIVPSQNLIVVRMGEAPDTAYDVPMQFDNDIWIRLNAVISNQTGVEDNIAPVQFTLKQNYPNPFNPSTKITFTVGTRYTVSLRIYDILGREIVTLVDGMQSAGEHTVEWDGRNSAGQQAGSGIYFCRASVMLSAQPAPPDAQRGERDLVSTGSRNGQTGTFVKTMKLMLLK